MLGPAQGEPTPLQGGITNRNYRARFGEVDVVIRLPGKDTDQLGIDRAEERAASEAAAAVGVGPEVVAMLQDPPCLVTRFIEGEPIEAGELRVGLLLTEAARALRRVHGARPVQASF